MRLTELSLASTLTRSKICRTQVRPTIYMTDRPSNTIWDILDDAQLTFSLSSVDVFFTEMSWLNTSEVWIFASFQLSLKEMIDLSWRRLVSVNLSLELGAPQHGGGREGTLRQLRHSFSTCFSVKIETFQVSSSELWEERTFNRDILSHCPILAVIPPSSTSNVISKRCHFCMSWRTYIIPLPGVLCPCTPMGPWCPGELINTSAWCHDSWCTD